MEEDGEEGEKLMEERTTCQNSLADTEKENEIHKVLNFQCLN